VTVNPGKSSPNGRSTRSAGRRESKDESTANSALAVNGEADAGGTRRCRPGGGGPLEATMDELIDHSSWMRDIPDQARLLSLSIPGTHNSCSVGGIMGFTKTQDLDLPDQLRAGIRFLDIRLSHYQDNLYVHHDVVHMGKCHADVLAACSGFLEEHPSETILMSIKDEGRCDSILGRFAPSRRLGKSRGDPMNWVVRSGSFEDAFKARTWEYVPDPALFYNLPSPRARDGSLQANLTVGTTLGEARGKIILLRRFQASQDVGFDLTYWPENMRFRSMTNPVYAVEDHWWDPGEGDKFNFMITHMEEARRRDPKDLYITFSSAVNLHARSYAKTLNPRLNGYLAKSPRGRVGIVAMDYFQDPPELVSNVINMNLINGVSVGRDSGYDRRDGSVDW
jgi:1-phosphatidylinositol phosphodiesterase